jgi:hypothetical protein
LRELIGLFVDDGWLAAILGVVGVAAITVCLIPGSRLAAGAILLCRLLTARLVNTLAAARQ